ncbi:MAG: helix-turn-helix domain-containing protein [Campylobacterota bacterium]|nr:helix-turn-helix domain-containing protein [Campylobacterota bacterium]
MENQILDLLHIINNKLDKLEQKDNSISNKVDNVIDRINDLEKDINNTPTSSSNIQYLTVKEISEIYKISREKIYQDIKSNEFNTKYSQKKNGGKILIKKKDWDLWFNSFIVPDMLDKYREKIKSEDLEEDYLQEEKELSEEIISKKDNSSNEDKKSILKKIKKGEDFNFNF